LSALLGNPRCTNNQRVPLSLVAFFSCLTNENERGREVSRGFVISKGRVLKILIKPSGRSYVESSYLLRLFVVEYILLLILQKSVLPGPRFLFS